MKSKAESPSQGGQRIEVIDILRGLAFLGMATEHFMDYGSPPVSAIERGIQLSYSSILYGRSYTLFAILFGAGFAIQLGRADVRGEKLWLRHLRRLLALAFLGLIAEVGFGFWVLIDYAIWGLPLLFVRRMTPKALLILAIACTAVPAIISTADYYSSASKPGFEQTASEWDDETGPSSALHLRTAATDEPSNFKDVIQERLDNLSHYASREFLLNLGYGVFVMFLLGLFSLRIGIFERPGDKKHLIAGLTVFGMSSWLVSQWLLPSAMRMLAPSSNGLVVTKVITHAILSMAGGVFSSYWLSFAYIGAVLFLIAARPRWERLLAPFAWVGRMALSNYMFQVILLSALFQRHLLGLHYPMAAAPVFGLGLFLAAAVFSRWWLARYTYGPLEWLWRSITNWQIQPMKL